MKFRAIALALAALPLGGPAFAAGGEAADAPAQATSQLNMALTLYAGGVTLGKVDMDATIRGDQYHVVSNLETSGIVNAFWQAQIQATSSGKIADKTFQPALYDSFDTNHSGKKQEVALTYEKDTPVRMYANPVFKTNGYDVKPEQQKGTFDPLSAVVYITSGAGAKPDSPCDVVAPVFDGRRRYNIEIVKVKDTTIKMDNGLYKGKALLCEMKYKQLAGFKPKIIKENASFPKINAWIATFPSSIPGRTYVVPLRVWADTDYGTVAAVATSLKVDGQTPKS
ncbi:MAG: DUF3108 domain-containing protein [Rhizomicrobium sp.]